MKLLILVMIAILAVPGFAQEQVAHLTEAVKKDTVDEPPAIVKRVSPKYPRTAQEEKAEGTVWLKVFVNEHGKPTSVEVTQSSRKDFSESAREAVMQFEFTPGKRKSNPVGVWVTIPFKFTLQESEAKIEFPEGPPTSEQIAMALSTLGIRVQPFRYTLPYEHRVIFTMDVYRDRKKESTFTGSFLQRANENSLVLTFRSEEGKLTAGISNPNTTRTFPSLNLGPNKALLYQNLDDVHVTMNRKSAFYVFAADPKMVESIKNGNEEAYIKRYPLVVVFSVELKATEGK